MNKGSQRRGNLNARLHELAEKNVDEILSSPVINTTAEERFREFLLDNSKEAEQYTLKEDAVFASLTIGDLIYDVSRVDPTVLEAADFARTEDLSSVFNFAYFAQRIEGLKEASYAGNVAQIQGYVAERLIAQHLQSQGMEVEFPTSPNQEGYDLLVNGEQFQVKCLSSTQGVLEHLERNPDIPVLVNEDLAEQLQNIDNVYPVPGILHDEVVEATESTLEAGDEILDFEIPLIAVVVASGRNVYAILRGKTDFATALQNIAIDVAGRSAGGIFGSKILSLAGLIFGPAGGVVGGLAGAVIGAKQGKRTASWIKANILCADEESALEKSLKEFLGASAKAMQANIDTLKDKQRIFQKSLEGQGKIKSALRENFKWRLEQELKYRKNKIKRVTDSISNPRCLDPVGKDILVATAEGSLLVAQSGVHPYTIQKEYNSLTKAIERLRKIREKYLL